ncbi:hypothetical protein [Bradyrhizobium uaiense]|uniref:Uncharacterized protein n=1 Tax=Bradyrhizobium uaiense TaxID=2594946 RepID=A0A6P1BG21_9BRAD|nr:hypothetical protein [Bradyrhizobium uaiense]NEU97486.1 hypothetical protein [Bradyrhizobium uaiense]
MNAMLAELRAHEAISIVEASHQEQKRADIVSAGFARMQKFIFSIVVITAASWSIAQAAAADRVPPFDIVRNCGAEVAAAGTESVASCTKDETDAMNELDKRWTEFSASNKQACVEEASLGGEQSYVELLTCLEMSSGEFLAGRH